MVDIWTLMAFIPVGLALNLSPGADMMFCLGLGLRSGPKAAVAASAGISTGGMVHVTLAGLGLGAAVAAMPWLFDVIRWIGVAYLLVLAWGALHAAPVASADVRPMGVGRAFIDGMIVNLLNPKVILFVLAFLPQFIDPEQGSILGQFLIFGLVLAIGGIVVNGGVGVFAGTLRKRLTGRRFARGLGMLSAGVFTVLAVRLAVLERV
ncbi:LysE family translocator [Roseovarius aestuarii]|uniref:Homoserine/homoserine lactone efflux protein n=1 Tax=Roseovarius aestuarii TaxID=475083 RepID=A0A1X7BTK4_9RHOB|nr:LysE family translocator [Roseovarius aestuarii]SMC12938.1 Homoserine/homoserine lactone efflux protein [Roseovarius aestuarii]